MWQYKAIVCRVVDGDTIDLLVDVGFRMYFRDRFRLWGIDSPERGQTGWAESKAALEKKLPVDAEVLIETFHPRDRDERDSFGRWLATIWLDGENINEWLVEQGFAEVYSR